MIFFQVAQPAPEDRFYSFQLDEKAVHLLIPPQILKGATRGYLRVLPLAEGQTRVSIAGAKLDLEIARDQDTVDMAELHPQIVSPPTGSVVWGEFAVGVEQLTLGDSTQLPIPTLRLPNGDEVQGHVVPDQKLSPHGRWVFNVDAGALTPGSNKLVVVSKDETGQEIESAPIFIDAVRPAAGAMLSGPCTADANDDRPANGVALPPSINDDKFGRGKVLNASNEGAPFCLPVDVRQKGLYQLMVTARGDIGGDALPTLTLTVDELPQAETTSRLATTEWQRVPVGHTFQLAEGSHMLNVRLRNGFGQGPDDNRNLFLQKYELVRLTPMASQIAATGGGSSPAATGGASMSSMQATAPSMTMATSAMAMQTGGATTMAGAAGGPTGEENLHITFAENIDGQMVAGPVIVRTQTWWPDQAHAKPPRVELFVNKRRVGTQTSRNPAFHLDPAAFKPGPNVVEARAILDSGAAVNSAPFTLTVPDDFPLPRHPFRPTLNYTVYDSGLSRTMTPPQASPGDPDMANFYSNGQSTVQLPDDLSGRYKVVVNARGDQYQGPPNLRVGLTTAGGETKLADLPVSAKMGPVSAGEVDLRPGPKAVTIAFTNDLAKPTGPDKGDRNLYVRAVHLVPVDEPDGRAPVASIAVAPKIIGLGSADAVVACVMSSRIVTAADLVIDQQPQHLNQTLPDGVGMMTFPVLTRGLAPGRHELKVVATDDLGKEGASPVVTFTVSAQPETKLSKYERALFLLNRFAYGPEPQELAAVLTLGEKQWLQTRLEQGAASPAEVNEQVMLQASFPEHHDPNQVAHGAIEYLLTEPNPVRARFVMWVENHFSTWITKDLARAKESEHESFMELGPAPFFDLLLTSATSPAMLYYLDQVQSYSHRLNENYAREIMELHTLGVNGGYTQKDVTTLADLLTGWTLANEGARDGSGGFDLDRVFGYDPNLNTGADCQVFGVDFPGVAPEKRFDRVVMALEMLTASPSCAHFISRKLCEHYVADPAPPKLVDDLAKVYLETGGDMRAMLLAMSQHPDFWASSGKVVNPIEFGVRTERMAQTTNPTPVGELIAKSGMGMFDRATPDGYPEDDGYSVNSNALLQRWRFAKEVENDFLAAGLIPSAWLPPDKGWDAGTTQRIVDLAAVRITGRVLGAASNEAAQKLLATAPANTDVRLHALATFICQLPENSLK